MDVQATAATATSLPPALAQIGSAPAPNAAATSIALSAHAAAVSAVAGTGSGSASNSGNAGSSSNSTIGPTPGLATLPAGPPDGSKKGAAADSTLASNVAKLFNTQEQNVSVSYQVEQDPNEIVTVFTDKQTGKVIVQFPSETLIALAKFFDKLDGNVVNKKV
jgi:flagellar protein FlaG